MPFNTKPTKKDIENRPVPQYFNPAVDDFEVLRGRNGANRVELFDKDGNPVDLTALIAALTSDRRGLFANRPAPGSVPIGTTYWAIDKLGTSDELAVSTGTAWVVL